MDYDVIDVKTFLQYPYLYDKPLSNCWIAKTGKRKKCYLELYCGFDIETYTDAWHYAYMWVWQFSIYGEKNTIVIGRSWGEFVRLIDTLIYDLELSKERRIIIGVANLSYEHQFMKKHFLKRWTKVFAKERRQPMLAIIDNCVEFRDVLMITGGNLATLAKEYTETQKLVGDLDYNVPRTYKTPLHSSTISDTDMQYCYNDVAIISEFMRYIFDTYIKPDRYIPLTKTGLLRREVKKEIASRGSGIKRLIYNEIYRCYIPDQNLYKTFMKYLFRGGYTHTNLHYAGYVIDCKSVDYTSSYPYTMLSYDGFPVSPLKRERPEEFYDIYNSGNYCMMFLVIFTGIRSKTQHSIESQSKCITISRNAIIDNGRVRRASQMEVWLTELDFTMYRLFYEWDAMKVETLYTSVKGRLPRYLLLPLARAYEKKALMKHAGKSGTPEYALYKSLVNSAFGMCCTRLVESEVMMSDISCEWYLDDSNFNFDDERKKAFLLPQWGIYICAYSRMRILNAIYMFSDKKGLPGGDACYSDTDSIKYIGDHDDVINLINEDARANMKKVCDRYNLNYDLFYDLGSFEKEYDGETFQAKFLGAKRYVTYHNGKYETTIAGLPKKSLQTYMNKLKLQWDIYRYGKYPETFDIFTDRMLLDSDVSLKNAHTYNDEPHNTTINGVQCFELSSVGIYPIDFTMKLSEFYVALIKNEMERTEQYENRIY